MGLVKTRIEILIQAHLHSSTDWTTLQTTPPTDWNLKLETDITYAKSTWTVRQEHNESIKQGAHQQYFSTKTLPTSTRTRCVENGAQSCLWKNIWLASFGSYDKEYLPLFKKTVEFVPTTLIFINHLLSSQLSCNVKWFVINDALYYPVLASYPLRTSQSLEWINFLNSIFTLTNPKLRVALTI